MSEKYVVILAFPCLKPKTHPWLCRTRQSKPLCRWWCPAQKRWSPDTGPWCRQTCWSSPDSHPGLWTRAPWRPCPHRQPGAFWRSRGGRRNRERWPRRRRQMPGCLQSISRTGCACLHRQGKSSCICPWKQSWGPAWGSTGWHWPGSLSRTRGIPVLWEYGQRSRWSLCTAGPLRSACLHVVPVITAQMKAERERSKAAAFSRGRQWLRWFSSLCPLSSTTEPKASSQNRFAAPPPAPELGLNAEPEAQTYWPCLLWRQVIELSGKAASQRQQRRLHQLVTQQIECSHAELRNRSWIKLIHLRLQPGVTSYWTLHHYPVWINSSYAITGMWKELMTQLLKALKVITCALTWSRSLTLSMGATAVLEMAAAMPPAKKSLAKEIAVSVILAGFSRRWVLPVGLKWPTPI